MSNIENIRHSLAHVLAAVVQAKYPGVGLGIGPTIKNGFYYDFEFPKDTKFTDKDLPNLTKGMKKLVQQGLPFSGKRVAPAEARKMFFDQPYKLELIKDFSKEKKALTAYKTGDVFLDLCKGGHVKNTKEIPVDAFALTHVAGAYWKGYEKNTMLTRVYGVAFATKKELDAYLKMREEAERRDHKKLGRELDLFHFSEFVGSGLPLFTPKGALLYHLLDDFVWELRRVRGYNRVQIPHITKKELFETSGHWEKFRDELFKSESREGHVFALKPMNCPFHTQIYARKPHSYRELPVRYANTTTVYRDEQSGELQGLSRVRAITQDDSHVFCRYSQVEEEAGAVWDIVHAFYGAFGFELTPRLSLHEPKEMQKYLGTPAVWKKAEAQLRALVKKRGAKALEKKGEAAFYGPKIDFMARDSIGREWQVATIQLDMNMPERFDLSCINEKGKEERIVMLHVAIMGSIERFLSILIEHYAGAFPLWLSPLQAAVLPIGESHVAYAREALGQLEEAEIRAEIRENDSLGKRIREAEKEKIPYVFVLGDREKKEKSVSVRRHGKGDVGIKKLSTLLKSLISEIDQKK